VQVDDLKVAARPLDAADRSRDQAQGMREVLDVLGKAAGYDVPVVLRGGKWHGQDHPRAPPARVERRAPSRPFVVVNCPTLSEELLASELFGHARGAFTGAVRDQLGRVESAAGGTLFLDEIGELPPSLQAKLLRFVQDHQFERVGETQTRTADVRIIAATNRDVEASQGRPLPRGPLVPPQHHRAGVPPLRERRDDIVNLGATLPRLLRAHRRRAPRRARADREAEAALTATTGRATCASCATPWERASILAGGSIIGPSCSRAASAASGETVYLGATSRSTPSSVSTSAASWRACPPPRRQRACSHRFLDAVAKNENDTKKDHDRQLLPIGPAASRSPRSHLPRTP